jgi:hypothetical protein
MKLQADIQNPGFSRNYWRMSEILASHENSSECLKFWPLIEILADA